MNGQFQVAQANGTGNSNNNSSPPRIFKLTKPLTDQAVVVNLGYDQKVQVDFSSIANEKITLVHVGEKLIILFDNQSTVTVEPFFDSRHDAAQNLTIEVAPGRDLSVAEFASSFPISTDQSVLPAAGTGGGNAQATGGNFSDPLVDPLPPVPSNALAPPETLPNLQFINPTGALLAPQAPVVPVAGPTITAGIGPDLVVDESFIPVIGSHVAVAGSPNSNTDAEAFAASFTVNAPAGVQSVTYVLSVPGATATTGVDSGLIDSGTGNHVFLFVQGGEVVGREGTNATAAANGLTDFTLSVNSSGNVTLTDLRGVHEGTGENPDISEGVSLAAGLVTLTATVTDNNNNTAIASEDIGPHITIRDDGPVATNVALTNSVDEDGLPAGILAGDGGNISQTIANGNVSTLFLSGADAPLHYSFTASTANLTAEGLTSGGVALTYAVTTANGVDTLTASAGGTTVFTLALTEATGAYTFTLLSHVDNATGLGETAADNLLIGLGSVIQATDSDGDSVPATGSLTISVVDDVPVATNVALTNSVDEDGLPAGILAGDGGNISQTIANGNVSTLFLSGADAPLHYSFTASTANLTAEGLTSGGVALTYAVTTANGVDTLTASAGGTTVFTLALTEATGAYTFTLLSHVDNATGLGETAADNLLIGLGSVIQATDSDGDSVPATGSLTISVVDDVPVATNVALTNSVDEDGLPAGILAGDGGNISQTIANGNVSTLFLSGADAPLHYSFTASTANLTAEGLTSGGVALTYAVTTANGVDTLTASAGGTTVFTLALTEATGAYTFTLLSHVDNATGLGETAADNLLIGLGSVIQATDSDGDSVPATGSLTISVVDDVPVATNVALTNSVDEDGLPAGILAGDGGNISQTIANGNVSTLFLSGADAPLHYSFTASTANLTAEGLTSGGVALTYAVTTANGVDTLTASAGGTTVFTLALTEATGAYTFTLLSHVDNATGLGETAADNLLIGLGSVIQATDSDGDSVPATGSLTISVVDDVPVATNVALTNSVDEDGLPAGILAGDGGNISQTIANGNVSTLFLSGADAPLHYSFTASTANLTAEGLTSGGVALTYAVTTANGVDTLTASAGGTTVFTLALTEATGAYTFTLLSHVDNATGLGETAADNLLIGLGSVIQATDSDGDSVPATGSLTISVVDDVPVATNVALTNSVDEDGLPAGILAGDGGNISQTIANGNVSTLFLSGADAPLHYSFTASTANLTAEGLTSGGVALTYAVTTANGVDTLTASAGGTTVFTLALTEATGAYTFTLLSHVDNATGLGETAADNLLIGLGSVIQATDSDGDSVPATGSLTISVVDDVPVATNVALTNSVDEDGLPAGILAGDGGNISQTIANGNVSTLFLSGADAPLHYSFTASTANLTAEGLTSGGVALTYAVTTANGVDTLTASAGGTTVFTLALTEATGAYTFTLLSHVDNATGLGETAADNLLIGLGSVIQATDSDGDSVPATGSLTISVVDDVPVATNVALTNSVDEDGLPAGILAGDGGNISQTIANGNVSTLFLSGADAPLHYSFTASTANLTAEGLTSGGVALTYAVTTANGVDTLTASAGGTTVFTLALTEATGAYTFTLLSHVDNATGLGETAADNLLIGLGSVIQATDSDGDSVPATGSLTISVVDDVPVATNVALTNSVDEDGLPAGILAGDGGNISQTIANGNVSTLFLSGADAPLHYSFTASTANLTAEGLTSGGVALTYAVTTANGVDTLTASAGGTTVFTLALTEATGAYTFTLLSHVDNATGLGETAADNLLIGLGSVIQATDSDGDSVPATGSLTISVVDDVPVATNVALTNSVDEDGLPAGILAGDGGNISQTIANGNVSTLFLSGADAPLHYSFTASTANLTAEGLTSGGVALTYAVTTANGVDTLTASAGGTTVFTLALTEATGAYTFTLLSHVDNATGLGETAADNLLIGLGSVIQATDSDGDSVPATGSLTISVVDDVPVATNVALTNSVDEDGLPAGILAGDGGNISQTIANGNVSTLFLSGADAPLHYSFTASTANLTAEGLTSGGVALTYAVTTANGVDTLTASAGGTTVFTLALTEATGAYTFTLLSHVDNATGLGETAADNLLIGLGSVIQATDSDGDSVPATGSLTISVIDDVPVISGIQNAIIPVLANTDVQGTWTPLFGADGPSFAPAGDVNGANDPAFAAIGIAVGPAPAGLTYTVTDTGTHNPNGEEVFSVAVTGGAQAYSFFEYTHYDAATHTAELFAYTDQTDADNGSVGTTNQFFTLSLSANGTYDFHLTSAAGLTSTVTTSFTGAGNSGTGAFAELTAGAATFVHNGPDPTTPPAGVDLVIDGFSSTDPNPNHFTVHANNNGFGLNNGNFETNQILNFEFAQSQTAVDLGIGKGNNGVNEHFLITLFDSSGHAFATENIILPDGQAVLIDSAHFGVGEAPGAPTTGTFGAFSSVTVENIAGANGSVGDDGKLNLTSVSFNEHTVISSTTLNFTPTITDGDGDSASTSLSVALNGTSNNGSFTLTGTGNDVLLSGPVADTINLSGNNNTIQYNHLTDGGGTGIGTGDTVNGFNATDSVSVSAAGFGGGLTFGEVFNSTQVQTAGNATFTNSSERFLFDTANHTLYYSADPTTGSEHAIAILNGVAAINATNVHVVA